MKDSCSIVANHCGLSAVVPKSFSKGSSSAWRSSSVSLTSKASTRVTGGYPFHAGGAGQGQEGRRGGCGPCVVPGQSAGGVGHVPDLSGRVQCCGSHPSSGRLCGAATHPVRPTEGW